MQEAKRTDSEPQRVESDRAAAAGVPLEGDAQLLAEAEQPAAVEAPREVARQWRRLGPDGPSLASPEIGFAELGQRAPSADGGGAQGGDQRAQGGEPAATAQLLSFRTFWPGQSYTPDVRFRPQTVNPKSPMWGPSLNLQYASLESQNFLELLRCTPCVNSLGVGGGGAGKAAGATRASAECAS